MASRERLLGLPGILGRLPARGQRAVRPGLYHYRREADSEKTRLHLRIDPDGAGTLVINASSILHLNPSAAAIAWKHLEGESTTAIHRFLNQVYQDAGQAGDDVELIIGDLEAFISSDGLPVQTYSGVEVNRPFSHHPSAPYRMDLALTYRCNNNCPHCYNARSNAYPELPEEDWMEIIDRLWKLHIPHLIFTGGEPTLREDLPSLIQYAENRGQITGLNTNARRLADPDYVEQLVDAGLDHIQITVESHLPEVHDQMVNASGAWKQTIQGLENALASDLFLMTNTTMLEGNYRNLAGTLDFLAGLGVPTIGLNALIYAGRGKDVGTGLSEEQLLPLMDIARERTSRTGTKLIWYTPTLYCRFNPLELDLGVKGCTAALYNMCVEPDGGVLPCQSYYRQLGNILDDPWDSIWGHELALSLRERKDIPDDCRLCSLLEECGAGCPLALAQELPPLDPFIPPPD